MKHLTKLPIFIYQFTATEEEIDFTWICALSSLNSIRKHTIDNNNYSIRETKPCQPEPNRKIHTIFSIRKTL